MLFDTYAWIELLTETPKGGKVVELMREEPVATAVATISELVSWAHKNELDVNEMLDKIKTYSIIIPFNEDNAKLAGKIHYENKQIKSNWGMVDSMIYATALANGLKLVTGDTHFQEKPEVVFL